MPALRVLMVGVAILGLAGCSGLSRTQQRALSGGAIGAAAGVGIAAATGGSSLLLGGLLGGAGGAVVGAVTH
ncbi:conserved protein of unknown function [Rhodovastum atsumiense]|uniref:YMGG-like Gly-zipper domain-containing protein n=1 Tax=Rhodovastum atsumiense TaxID=504468 RepID=A0A5M6J0W3_9PROT|nr:hypothetical protein [Rhodovastum atsumiense]KAA5613839.1 hypothetical protein F1189_03430 [Rhodovastum atsumiense]CAH2601949.1 conserved protein of unknown function [Rhodovastum atsumiense]